MSIEELKKLQKEIIKKDKKCNIIGSLIIIVMFIITIFVMFFMFDFSDNYFRWFIIAFVMIFELIIYSFIISTVKNNLLSEKMKIFHNEYKNIFIMKYLKEKFTNVKYDYNKGLDENIVKKIMDTGDIYKSNDYINGKYNGINFSQADVHIIEEVREEDDEGNVEYSEVTLFLGRVMIFDFNKNFKHNVFVKPNGTSFATSKYNKIEMEDITFNELFDVYAENDHDAFYLLTPSFMEKLISLRTKLNNGFILSFIDNKLFVAINNNKDSFEYNIFEEINEDEIINDVNKDLDVIIDLVNDLDLDKHLFK